jgi:hypothetical protein
MAGGTFRNAALDALFGNRLAQCIDGRRPRRALEKQSLELSHAMRVLDQCRKRNERCIVCIMIDDDMYKNAVDRACDLFAEQEFLGDSSVPNARSTARHDDGFRRWKPEFGTHFVTPHVQRATPQFGPVAALKVRACQGRTLIGIGLSPRHFRRRLVTRSPQPRALEACVHSGESRDKAFRDTPRERRSGAWGPLPNVRVMST